MDKDGNLALEFVLKEMKLLRQDNTREHDQIREWCQEISVEQKANAKDLNGRVRKLEIWRGGVVAISGALSAGLVFFLRWVGVK